MSVGLALRVCLAVVGSVTLGFLVVRVMETGRAAAPAASTANFVPRLTLVRQASTGDLISLRIQPDEVGQNEFLITLLTPVGEPQKTDSANLSFSRLESGVVVGVRAALPSGMSRQADFALSGTGWWQIAVTVNQSATASFYLKLDQPSTAPDSFAPPDYSSDANAQRLFSEAKARYEGLKGMKWREELSSGLAGEKGFGVWYITNFEATADTFHATTTSLNQGGSELFSDPTRFCNRDLAANWQCSPGPAPLGPFELSFLDNALAFRLGREEVVAGEMSQVVFFYSPSQSLWYVWWVGEQSHFLRRQVMVGKDHFLFDSYRDIDVPPVINPKNLPA